MKRLIYIILIVLLYACGDEEVKLESSDNAAILNFNIEETTAFTPVKTHIDTISREIHVFSSIDFDESIFPLSLTPEIEASPGAMVSPASGTAVTLNDPEDFVKYTITSKDEGKQSEYIFTIRDRQIPNSEFNNWFEDIGVNAKPFIQPGKYLESTVWATTNMGTSIYSIYGTSPDTINDNISIKIETVATITLPLVAGALYLGKFDIDAALKDPTDPVAAADLGIPFYGKPTAVQFKYAYQPGVQLIRAEAKDPGNIFGGYDIFELDGTDKLGIEAVLERRIGEEVTIIAKANFQSSESIERLTTLNLPLEYFSNEEPTHFYVSFSPSLDGGDFIGAVGSTLIIDNLELLYE